MPRGEKRLDVSHLSGPGVEDVSFTLYRGEILGVAGLMGAGRTELMKYGAAPRKAGTVSPTGATWSPIRRRTGWRTASSISRKTASATARAGHVGEGKHVADRAALFQPRRRQPKQADERQAVGISSDCSISKRRRWSSRSVCFPAAISKVAIARGLMTRPKVLILDERRAASTSAPKRDHQLINQFKQEGLSIILVSSEMPEVMGMSDRILVMHEGHLSGEFPIEQATQKR